MRRAATTLHRAAPALGLLALLAGFAGAAGAASIEAEIDRNEATVEDRLTLTVTVTGSTGAEPELPELADFFEVVPAGQSKQWNFINGRASSSTSYRYVLLPREPGDFVIGPAAVEIDGERLTSQPFTVRIRQAGASTGQERDLFLTTQLSTATPYVGQQVLFTWRLYRRVRIGDARLDPFEFNGFLAEELGEVRDFETRINGRTFAVSEIRKALFPQELGELVIPATRLTCQVPRSARRRQGSVFDDMFDRVPTETRVLRSEPLSVQVRPLPDAPAGFSGLVGSFELEGTVSETETRVGDSVTLTIEVSGAGNVQMIPEPPLPELPAVKVYDDKPGSNISRRPSGLSGSRTFRKALVPQAAGVLTLPPVRLVYFDPDTGTYRTAATAEIPLQVLPAKGQEELGLTESLAPSTGKVAVRILADDILPLYAGVDGIGGPGRPRPATLAALLLLPPLLYLGGLAAARRRDRYRQDSGLARRRRALARARRRLRRIAGGDGDGEATEAMSLCVRRFLGDKLGLEGTALTAAETRDQLASRGLAADRVEQVAALLDRLEAARYGTARAAADRPEEVAALLRRLDREL